jgi:hypothetical protein
MSDKISGKFHPIPSTIANQRWISIRNIIIYLETKFRPNRRIVVFGGHFVPWLPWQRPPFWICSTPKAATHHGGYSYKLDHNMAPKLWISIPNIKIYLETKFRPNRRIFIFGGHFVPLLPQKSPNDPHIRIRACGCKFHHYQPISHFKILLYFNFHWNRRPLTIRRPTMNINSQHHNLLGNQISSKSEDFCILAAILDSKWPP